MAYQSKSIFSFFIFTLILAQTDVFAQNNWDKIQKNIEFAYDLYEEIDNYTSKIEEISDQTAQFHQLLGDIIIAKPSDVLASNVAKPIGEILKDFKKEAQDINVPVYTEYVISSLTLGNDPYINRENIGREVEDVIQLNRYYQKILDIQTSLADLENRYNEMKDGIHEVQKLFQNNQILLSYLKYDWIAFETTYPNILSDAHQIIKDKIKLYEKLERQIFSGLRPAALNVQSRLQEEREKNRFKQDEIEQLKNLIEEVKLKKKEIEELESELKKNESLFAKNKDQVEKSIELNNSYDLSLNKLNNRLNEMSVPGYVEATYTTCPEGNSWSLCSSVDHVNLKEKHRNEVKKELVSVKSLIQNFTVKKNQNEDIISKSQFQMNEYLKKIIFYKDKYSQKLPILSQMQKDLNEKSKQFLDILVNNLIESFVQNNQSETQKIANLLSALN